MNISVAEMFAITPLESGSVTAESVILNLIVIVVTSIVIKLLKETFKTSKCFIGRPMLSAMIKSATVFPSTKISDELYIPTQKLVTDSLGSDDRGYLREIPSILSLKRVSIG